LNEDVVNLRLRCTQLISYKMSGKPPKVFSLFWVIYPFLFLCYGDLGIHDVNPADRNIHFTFYIPVLFNDGKKKSKCSYSCIQVNSYVKNLQKLQKISKSWFVLN